jgi:hypothetical protein
LVHDERAEEEARELVEDVVWLGLEVQPFATPFGMEPEQKEAEVEAEFWSRTGFPMEVEGSYAADAAARLPTTGAISAATAATIPSFDRWGVPCSTNKGLGSSIIIQYSRLLQLLIISNNVT